VGSARWRRQALTWLRGDLARWRQRLAGGKPADRDAVQKHMRHWQRDPDLAGPREEGALAKLPAEERQACQHLWADVEALLEEAQRQE
jgi:hypothetical protein